LLGDKTVQRTVLYLGEINDQQQGAWRKTLEVFDEQEQRYTTMSLFPDDREIPAERGMPQMRTVASMAPKLRGPRKQPAPRLKQEQAGTWFANNRQAPCSLWRG
jgi:hypothetical protein